ncbi:nucleolin-like isoform X2 [Cheilinus undulatus]|uniref:nucleolin-like isoform X2 n=1 Tax=Cheilinus undulatus TaxID=241271 RepID=UPI001BD6A83C|nr:nucleolin-like isoform X2 [Cheilinus undulatus]
MATRRRKRLSKTVADVAKDDDAASTEGQLETVSSDEQIVLTEMDAPTESTETKMQEDQDEEDSQMDTVIEVKGSVSTVNVTWDEKNEEGQPDDKDENTSGTEQVESESQMDAATEEKKMAPPVIIAEEKKEEDGVREDIDKETDEVEEVIAKVKTVKGKRKAHPDDETSPSKKTKLNSDGFCIFIGNLNNSKKFDKVKNSLANFFMTQSILVQDIRLHHSRTYAHIDVASQMDLTKALTLDGEMVLNKPMTVTEAKVKSEDKVKVKASEEDKKAAKDARSLFLKNVPYNATKEDILKLFHKAVKVRFPGGAESPKTGIAFVEFENKSIAEKVRQKKRLVQIQGRVLIVDAVRATNRPKATKDNNSKSEVPPSNTLFVYSLSSNVKEKHLMKVFKKAVSISVPQSQGKSKGFAFVEFATVADAEKAWKSSKNTKICKRPVKVKFSEMRGRQEKDEVESKTLMVIGLAEKTTAETLKSAFDGALSARVIQHKETSVSKRFGFVEFESEACSKAVKEAMEDCEIDGSQVTLAYAKPKGDKAALGGRQSLLGHPGCQPAGQGAARGAKARKGGKGRGPPTPQDVKEIKNKV